MRLQRLAIVGVLTTGLVIGHPVLRAFAEDDTLSLVTIDGRPVRFPSGQKPTYLKFWATWCVQCRAEAPHLQELYSSKREQVEFVAVNIGFGDTPRDVKDYLKDHEYTFPVVFDETGDLMARFDVWGTPTHVLFDKEGRICARAFSVDDQFALELDTLAESGRCRR